MPAARIDKATVERMLLAYIINPNPTHVAKACDVSWQTAKKYIVEGAPMFGLGPFAVEARRALRAGDKIVKLTEVTKQVRLQVEEKDLGALQDMLFGFEATIHDGIQLVQGRMARERNYHAKIEDLRREDAPEAVIAKVKKPGAASMTDLKCLAVAIHELVALKREFWDRLEVVRSTEVETTVNPSGDDQGLVSTTAEPIDFEGWEPHEIAAYVDSLDDGDDPVFPEWYAAPTPSELPSGATADMENYTNEIAISTHTEVAFPPPQDAPED